MKRALLFALVYGFFTTCLYAQHVPEGLEKADSTASSPPTAGEYFQSRMSLMGIPLIASGLIAQRQNENFKALRNRFDEKFHHRYDDYLQYVPLASTWVMKAAGVESQSSWKELALSNTFSALLMAGCVNALKYTVREERPDQSSRNSFPSGHTATAFMGATILHKEYGRVSPWISIGGYTLAGVTGVMRQLNNRHWVGDVLVGAGIGITTTELGYFLSDVVLKPRHATGYSRDISDTSPSFLGFDLGMRTGPSVLKSPEIYDTENGTPLDMRLKIGSNTVVGVEGAYFFNSLWGIGGRVRIATLPITADIPADNLELFDLDSDRLNGAPVNMFLFHGLESDHLGICDTDLGVYFSLPFGQRFRAVTKCLIGRRWNAGFSLNSISSINPEIFDRTKVSESEYQKYYREDVEYYMAQENITDRRTLLATEFVDEEFLNIRRGSTFKAGTGISLHYQYKDNAAFKIFCDYDYSNLKLTYEFNNSWADEHGNTTTRIYRQRTPMHNLTFGSSILFLF